jgi:RNA polymerase sigma factor (sigma-70 family)
MQNAAGDRTHNFSLLQKSLNSGNVGARTLLENAPNRDLLKAWRNGDQLAAQVLVRRYMVRLTALARSRLSDRLARRVDSDDIVMSAWRRFFIAVDQSRINVPEDDNLWPLLVTMTLRKLSRQAARHSAERRAIAAESNELIEDWQDIVSRDPTPDETAMVTDELESLMSRLSITEREILTRRLQGEQQADIAMTLDCSERTVRRSLQHIREQFVQYHRDAKPPAIVRGPLDQESPAIHPAPSDPKLVPSSPTVAFDQILLQELIGQGTFGKVYRSHYKPMNSTVAVKFLNRRLWENQDAVNQLIQEFELINNMNHRGIVHLQGWGRTPQGATFLVMEWINGSNLQQWRQLNDLSPKNVIECGLAICEAVAAAHLAGIVHGDLTPNNILREPTGRFVLTDFGLSHIAGQTFPITIGGTPGYLAPEQLSQVFGAVGVKTDVFGLGGILYFLLTGQPPITGQDIPEIIANSLSTKPITPASHLTSGASGRLCQTISQCLQKELSERPQTVLEVRNKLTQVVDSN